MLKLLIKNTKTMSKQKTKRIGFFTWRTHKLLAVFSAGIIGLTGIMVPSLVRAVECSTVADCTQQEQSLQQQNSANQQALSTLEAQAGSYQGAINVLQSQISGLEQQIATNEATQASLQQQIVQDQVEIGQQKQVLASDITAMYVSGQLSTVEMLATSKNLNQFIDAETYRGAVENKVQSTLNTITQLQAQLKQQQAAVAAALAAQQSQQSQLANDESQQASLLAMNQQQQAGYNSQIQSNQAAITQLQAKIVALNTPVGSDITASGTCGGGYPTSTASPAGGSWGCDYPKDNTIDDWGMDNRECVSYTAFMVHEEYLQGKVAHDMPNWGGVGDAYQWIGDAESAGVPVDQNPSSGDIAIRPASGTTGDVGHAMYVAVVGNSSNGHPGAIYVQQYNADLRGDYSEGWRSTAGLYFLHFSQWQ